MREYLTYLDSKSYLFWRIEVTGRSIMTTHGDVGTVGQTTIEVFDNEKECLRTATDLIGKKKESGYGVTSEGYIAKYELPSTLKKDLVNRCSVTTQIGSFGLFASHEIKLISVVVDHHYPISHIPAIGLSGNPYGERKGLFCTTAYSLVNESPDRYPAEGLLVWLPLLELFGTWDRVHRQLFVFADISWAEIAGNLPDYLQRCTKRDGLLNILECEKLLNNFDFIPDDLPDQIGNIISGLEIKREVAEEFLSLYEQRLLRHPWCSELEPTYEALVNLYHRIGQSHEREAEYNRAIEWLGRSLLVVNQSHHFRSQVFIDIFIQLSFCYFETSRFDSSLRYMKMYQVYDSSAFETCEQIITSITRVKHLYEEAIISGQRAIKRRSAECYEEAIRITHEAAKIAPNDPLLYFNLACFYSLSYKTKEALYYLEEALKKGYKNHRQITDDEDLENIRSTREFEVICQRYL